MLFLPNGATVNQPIKNYVVKLKVGKAWSHCSVVRDRGPIEQATGSKHKVGKAWSHCSVVRDRGPIEQATRSTSCVNYVTSIVVVAVLAVVAAVDAPGDPRGDILETACCRCSPSHCQMLDPVVDDLLRVLLMQLHLMLLLLLLLLLMIQTLLICSAVCLVCTETVAASADLRLQPLLLMVLQVQPLV